MLWHAGRKDRLHAPRAAAEAAADAVAGAAAGAGAVAGASAGRAGAGAVGCRPAISPLIWARVSGPRR